MQVSKNVADFAVAVIAVIHAGIGFAEIFLWKRDFVYRRIPHFRFTAEEASKVAPIVANAGLYNCFLAAGLLWALLRTGGAAEPRLFFLACVVVAGAFGTATLKTARVFVLQTAPALVAAWLVWAALT